MKEFPFKEKQTILFIGDSITDCGRSRENPEELGRGYANMVAAFFSALHPEMRLRFLNRGISGNRATDLADRWHEDCIALRPSWVSILIGINDVWRRYDSNDPTSVELFEEKYRKILNDTQQQIGAGLIMLEPFVLPCPPDRIDWRDDLDPKIQVVRKLAREFKAIYVPLDGLFAASSMLREPEFWAGDGVHPSQAGHALIAHHWLTHVGAVKSVH
ncbi:MAG: SGNH/GDSL hydrolase family protein [Puniceicoccales bacterium]